MKTLDIIAVVLLIVGGLNWGLVGILGYDVVAHLFGAQAVLARLVYTLVGLSAVYGAVFIPGIRARWSRVPAPKKAPVRAT